MFNWIITTMDCHREAAGEENVVTVVHWACEGTDGEYNARVYSTCGVPAPSDTFTRFEDLTKDQVLSWIWANGVDKDATETAVGKQLENLANPPIVQPPLPWLQ